MWNGKKDVNTQGFIVVTDCECLFKEIADQYNVAYAEYYVHGDRPDHIKELRYAFRIRATRFEFTVLIEDFKKNYPDVTVVCFKD